MSDINQLESRLRDALARIGAGLDGLAQSSGAETGTDEALRAQLDEERTANAQLEERVKALKERQDTKIADLEARVSAQTSQMADWDAELQKLRASNAELRELNAQLRSAAADGMAEPELMNRALMAEVDALQAQRGADAAEVDAILSALKPILEESSHAPG